MSGLYRKLPFASAMVALGVLVAVGVWIAWESGHQAATPALTGSPPAPAERATVLPATTAGTAQAPANSSAQPAPGGLAVELTADRQAYTLGEPVVVSVRFSNPTSSPIKLYRAFRPAYGFISLLVARKGGAFQPYFAPGFGIADAHFNLSEFAPGEQVTTTFKVLYNRAEQGYNQQRHFYAFEDPGTYLLQLVVANLVPGQRVTSQPIEVQMRAPQGDDAVVWRLLQTPEEAFLLHEGQSPADPAVKAEFEQILVRYPKTLYAPYMRAALEDANVGRPTAAPEVALRDVNGQLLFVRAQAGISTEAAYEVARSVLERTSICLSAYNVQNFDKFAECFSLQTDIRRKWDQGPGDRDRQEIETRFARLYAANGTLAIEIKRITVSSTEVRADVIGVLQHSAKQEVYSHMKFVLDSDGTWRILELGFWPS